MILQSLRFSVRPSRRGYPLAVLAALLIAPLLLLSAGCTSGSRLSIFRDDLLPREGSPLNPELISELQKLSQGARDQPQLFPVRKYERFVWLLPYYVSKVWIAEIPFDGGGDERLADGEAAERPADAPRVEAAQQRHFDLGLPGIALPIYHRTRESVWTSEPDSLPAEASYTFTPFWVWQKNAQAAGSQHNADNFDGDKSGPGFSGRASGVPLFFWQTHQVGKPWHFEPLNAKWEGRREQYTWATFLGLGPSYWLATEELPIGGPLGDKEGLKIYWSSKLFSPLSLGGAVGRLLWSDYRYWASVPGGQTMQVGHGPLFGLPLYTYTESRTSEDQPKWMREPLFDHKYKHVRRIVLGALWMDVRVVDDPKQAEYRNFHNKGILWTGFGWGHDEDSYNLRFLWLNIPVKKKAAGN